MSPRFDVFLSHSNSDRIAVEEIGQKLVDAGILPFFATWQLVPGEAWQEALEEALEASRACAVFLGPGDMGAWQHEEMRTALEIRVNDKAFRVIPVLLPGAIEPRKEKLPPFLRRFTWVDFREGLADAVAFRRLLSGIRGIAPGSNDRERPTRPRSMASPRGGFVHRREYVRVLEALCPPPGAAQPGRLGITTALRGAGGFGKTDLALAICQDPRVWEAYPDGILWTTMGEDLDAHGRLARVRDLIRWWTQEEAPAFETVSAAGANLRELLIGSRVVLVIDDVWSSADLTPFQGLTEGSALLVTTRDQQTLPAESIPIDVDAMSSQEAVSLLRLGLPDGSETEFASLATNLGAWPLLLKLVNRQLQELVNDDGISIPNAIREIKQALDAEGFAAFDRDDGNSRHVAASQAILLSVRRLPAKDYDRFFQLAVFPEDAEIPLSVLSRYWALNEFQTRKLSRRLYDLSLLLEFDGKAETVRLHDVIRRVLIEQVGERLWSHHLHLLELFQPVSGSWSDLSSEKHYLWHTLEYHLTEAGRKPELRQLLCSFSFLRAKLKATDVSSVIAGYRHLAEEDEPGLIREAIGLSAHVISKDPLQLASQIIGRLKNGESEGVQQLVNGAESWRGGWWLRPKTASLAPPGGPLLRILGGHQGPVRTVAAINQRQVISGSDDRTLRIWDLETGQTLRILNGHRGLVSAVAMAAERRAVSVSFDGTLRLWNLQNGNCLRTFEGRCGPFTSISIVDERRAITSSLDNALRVWDLATGQKLATFLGHADVVNVVAAVDNARVVSASDDKSLRMWDLETGKTLKVFDGHGSRVTAVAVLDHRRAVSGSLYELRVWDLETGELLRALKGDGAVAAVDARRVAAASDLGLRVWDLETGETLREFADRHTAFITAISIVGNRRAVTASKDGTLRVWDLEANPTQQRLDSHRNQVSMIAAVDSLRVVSASYDSTLRLWDLRSGKTIRTFLGHKDWVRAVSRIDERRVVSTSNDATLRVWDLETGHALSVLEGHENWVSAVEVVDKHRVVSHSLDGTLRVWDVNLGQATKVLRGHTNVVIDVKVVDEHRAVSASYDSSLRVWDLETGQTLKTIEGGGTSITALAVVDSSRVCAAFSDGTLRVWDLESGRSLGTLEGHSKPVTIAAVWDGQRIVSGSVDGTWRIWDLRTGLTLRSFEGHTNTVTAVALFDNRRAISASLDGTLRLWDLETGGTLFVNNLDTQLLTMITIPESSKVVASDWTGGMHFFDVLGAE